MQTKFSCYTPITIKLKHVKIKNKRTGHYITTVSLTEVKTGPLVGADLFINIGKGTMEITNGPEESKSFIVKDKIEKFMKLIKMKLLIHLTVYGLQQRNVGVHPL